MRSRPSPVTEISVFATEGLLLVTGLARLLGRILLSVHMGNFSPVDRAEISHMNRQQIRPGNRASPVDRAHMKRPYMKRPRDLGNRDENFPI